MMEVNEYELKITNSSCSEEFPTFSVMVLACLNSISGLVTVCGNLLVLMAIFRTPSLREASYVFIGSLAAADLTIGLVMNPMYAAIVGQNITDADHPLNVAEHYLWIHTVITTTFNLAGMSIEKYIAVIYPLRYPLVVTTRRAIVAVIAIWCMSLLFMCARVFINQSHDIETFWIAHSAIAIAIPLCVIIVCHFYILKAIRKQQRRINLQPNVLTLEQNLPSQTRTKAAWTIAIVIFLTVLFWTPNIVMTALNFFAEDECAKVHIFRTWVWYASVAFISSAINPFVYSIRMREFRTALRRMCSSSNYSNDTEIVHEFAR